MSHYTLELIATEALKCQKFRDRLQPGIFVYMVSNKDDDFSELNCKAKEFERGNWLKNIAEAGVQNLRIRNLASSSRTSSKRSRSSRDLGRNLPAQSLRSTGSFAQCRQFPSSSMASSEGSSMTPTMHVSVGPKRETHIYLIFDLAINTILDLETLELPPTLVENKVYSVGLSRDLDVNSVEIKDSSASCHQEIKVVDFSG
ncbi:hypothetical protein GQ457_01G022450 [Hibiscus cannabinus]